MRERDGKGMPCPVQHQEDYCQQAATGRRPAFFKPVSFLCQVSSDSEDKARGQRVVHLAAASCRRVQDQKSFIVPSWQAAAEAEAFPPHGEKLGARHEAARSGEEAFHQCAPPVSRQLPQDKEDRQAGTSSSSQVHQHCAPYSRSLSEIGAGGLEPVLAVGPNKELMALVPRANKASPGRNGCLGSLVSGGGPRDTSGHQAI
ncbi:uncharacterized protein [Anas acuta]|uniref:uncharacterized protein isoform X1 n=1 Tax=Anas acuta TaxID=28680 RepID=UPI0035C9415C